MESIMAPHPHRNGALRAHSFHILRALKKETRTLLDSMNVFVNDPLMEWRPKVKNNNTKLEVRSEDVLEQDFAALSVKAEREHAFSAAKKKLDSLSPFSI